LHDSNAQEIFTGRLTLDHAWRDLCVPKRLAV
jgi:hypothetical protein